MQHIHVCFAQSGEAGLIQQLRQNAVHGVIHSVFERTVNIRCAGTGELYTIASHRLDNGPNTLRCEIDSFDDLQLKPGDSVYVVNGMLYLGRKLAVSIQDIQQWNCVLPEFPADQEVFRKNLPVVKRWIDSQGISGGMKRGTESSLFNNETYSLLKEISMFLLDALDNGNVDLAVQYGVRLVGLGPGLTPSGDDFLVGLFTIINLPNSPLRVYKSFCTEILRLTVELTNIISYTALSKAAAGQVRENIISFLRALLYSDSSEAVSRLKPVLDIGSSSGTDIAVGLIAGLELNLEHNWR